MWEWLLDPLQFEFMRNAIATGILLGILSAVVGSYLIVQQLGMIGEVIAHAVLPGISVAFFLGINLSLGAFITGVLSALIIAGIKARSPIKADAAMALVLTSFLALGITLITVLETNEVDISHLLFGDILSVRPGDVGQTFLITLTILTAVKLFYKELLFYTFDPLGAQASGLPVNYLYFGLICAITLTIVASIQTVGVLLVISLLVGPAITAYLLVKELHEMMILGAVFGVLATISGMYISYHYNLPSGAAIVLIIFALFLLAFLFSPSQGLLTQRQWRSRVIGLLNRWTR
jgi:ABC-type Mn2+/Zn2+ transport system permease subunit